MIITEKKKKKKNFRAFHRTARGPYAQLASEQTEATFPAGSPPLLSKGIWKFVTLTFAEVLSVAAVCCPEIGELNLPGGRSNFGPKPLTDSVPDHSGAAARKWIYVLHNDNAPKVKVKTSQTS